MCPSKFRRAYVSIFSEEFIRVAFVGKTEFGGDFIYAQIAMQQSCFNQFQPVIDNVPLHGFICMLLEIASQVELGNTEMACHGFSPEFLGKVNVALYVLKDIQSSAFLA
jgi:hypothetical protein